MEDLIVTLVMYTIPALITGIVAYLFFNSHIENENKRRNFLISKDLQKEALPIRLQAYERLTLFLERISPSKLVLRVTPNSQDKNDYEALLVATIEQEYEHNLTQQIYVSNPCWAIINTAKNNTIQSIRNANMNEKTDSADKLRTVILTALLEKEAPSTAALAYLKTEVSRLLF